MHLSSGERQDLDKHHHDGLARFWGAKPRFDRDIDQLTPGDLVLFTGQSKLRYIGTLGFKTRNERLASALWQDEPSWTNVYSITELQPIADVSYPQLAALLHFSPQYSFQGTQLLTPEQASRVIVGAGIDLGNVQAPRQAEQPGRRRRAGIAVGLDRAAVQDALDEWRDLGKAAFLQKYEANEAARYAIIDRDSEADAMAILLGARHRTGLPADGHWRGDLVNVAAPLRKLGFAVVNIASELEGPLGPQPSAYVTRAHEFLGPTDSLSLQSIRREQSFLRGALGIGTGRPGAQAQCALCGRLLPEDLLVAAHIKPRARCTESERLDIPNIAMPACLLGCDALYERGYITVDGEGTVRRGRTAEPHLLAQDQLIGRKLTINNATRAEYFAWHHAQHA
ncbi:hypothetical protein [Kineosporia sp. NBRC 101731]|uniref:hypothetical protein n=1 Tax=Kineosporia sp. NBRC 101731 TaxID=3032199 RepID=UPI0024A3A828|nr:hypothetical protein [Kineosporia sp. NBRC 101731]GLY32501.1 hypothetical protein Kisp02_58660 [Kineosporia sp. NBRC 101731]